MGLLQYNKSATGRTHNNTLSKRIYEPTSIEAGGGLLAKKYNETEGYYDASCAAGRVYVG